MNRRLPLAALLCALLTACTGIEDAQAGLQLLVINQSGATLGYADSNRTDQTGLVSETAITDGVDVESLNGGRNFALALRTGLEYRNTSRVVDPAISFPAPPFTPVCNQQVALNALRTQLLALSDCAGVQQLALYRVDQSKLLWTALLPTPLVTVPGVDTPPTRIAVGGANNAVVARASLNGGSEVILVTPRNTGDPVLDSVADVSNPVGTGPIRDLAPYGSSIYAATDTGVRPLLASGLPDSASNAAQTAFGTTRYDRLWAGSIGSRNLLAAWRSNLLSNTTNPAGEYLKLWDGLSTRTSAVNVDQFNDLRDVTFAVDGRLYALTGRTLSSYDTSLGLVDPTNWNAKLHTTGLNNPLALTWIAAAPEE